MNVASEHDNEKYGHYEYRRKLYLAGMPKVLAAEEANRKSWSLAFKRRASWITSQNADIQGRASMYFAKACNAKVARVDTCSNRPRYILDNAVSLA